MKHPYSAKKNGSPSRVRSSTLWADPREDASWINNRVLPAMAIMVPIPAQSVRGVSSGVLRGMGLFLIIEVFKMFESFAVKTFK